MTDTRTRIQSGTAPQLGSVQDPWVDVETHEKGRSASLRHLRILWEERGQLFKAILWGVVLGMVLAFLLPKRYESSTLLMPPDNPSNQGLAMLASLSGKMSNGLGAVAGDMLGIKSSGALFMGVLRSRTVQTQVVERFDLKNVYSERLEEDACRKLAENTAISEDRQSGIIKLTVTDSDPQRAAKLARGYIEELDHVVAQVSTSSARRERLFLEERLKAVKQELDAVSQQFSQFASENTAMDIKDQAKSMMDAAATVMGQLIASEAELKGLLEIYKPDNIRVRSVQARISELRRQLERMGGRGEDLKTPGLDKESSFPSIRKLPLLGVTYNDFYRQTKIEEAVYETLTQQYELAKVQEAKEIPTVKVLDTANIPERKSFPPRLLIIFSCALLGPICTAIVILSKAFWKKLDPRDPGKLFAQEVFRSLGESMPRVASNGSRVQAAAHRIWVLTGRKETRETKQE